MKTIIIPDIHNNVLIANTILDRYPNDPVVFLGDYFDDFHDTKWMAQEVAAWVKPQLNDQRKTWLFGNHDLPYAYPQVNGLMCSGFSWDKCGAINQVLDENDWKMFKFSHFVEGWVLTHAGISSKLTLPEDEEITRSLRRGDLHPILNAGKGRGGWARCGGITWCDFNREFKPNPLYPKQIFGHTQGHEPRSVGDNWCIDTKLRHYGIIEDGEFRIENV